MNLQSLALARRCHAWLALVVSISCFSSSGCGGGGEPEPCGVGTFEADGDAGMGCIAFSNCAPGEFVEAFGTPTTDRVCAPCDVGTFSAAPNATSCTAWTECAAGERVMAAGSATTDRACTACDVGAFSIHTNALACDDWRDCMAGTFVSNTPSTSVDRVCMECAEGTTTSGDNQALCVAEGSCEAGTVQTAPGSESSPPTCADCVAGQYCAGSDTSAVDCGADDRWDHDGEPGTPCASRSVCAVGHRVVDDGSATSNRTCAACVGETFSATTNAPTCTPWRTCGSGTQATPGSSTMDRTCSATSWLRQFGDGVASSDFAVATNSDADVYFAGTVHSALPGQTGLGNSDLFLRKYDVSGTLLWTRQFGTSGEDMGAAVTVDSNGNVIVVGYTAGSLPGFTNPMPLYWDVAVFAFDSEGDPLWSRQLGGAALDYGYAVTTDGSHNVFVAGCTMGALPGHTHAGRLDTYLAKLDADGDLQWTRQLGGTSDDCVRSITTNAAGNVFMTGLTDGALPGRTSLGQTDMFLLQYDTNGTLVWSNHVGTADWEEGFGITADAAGNLYLAGLTNRVDPEFVTHALVEKYDATGALLWSRTFGTEVHQYAEGIDVDNAGNVFVGGNVVEPVAAGEPSTDLEDVFIATYDTHGNPGWSRRFGTIADDALTSVAVSPSGILFVGGFTYGTFPGQPTVVYGDAFVSLVTPP